MFYGKNDDAIISSGELTGLGTTILSTNTTKNLGSVTTGAGEYLVLSYDADHADLDLTEDFSLDGYTAGFTKQTTSNYQNPAGRTADYTTYVSNISNPTAGVSMAWRSDGSSTVYERKWGFIEGVSDPSAFSSANFKDLVNSSRNKSTTSNNSTTWGTHTCGASERLVLCIPSSLPDINIDEGSSTSNDVLFDGISCGFDKATSVSLENDYGYTSAYDVYISKRVKINNGETGTLDIDTGNTDKNEHIWGVHTESAASITELTSDELYNLTEGGEDDTEGNYDEYRDIQSSMNIGANEWIVYAHRGAQTNLTVDKFKFNDLTMGMTKLSSTVNYMNRNGFTEAFDVYVSNIHDLGTGDFEYSSTGIVNQTKWGVHNDSGGSTPTNITGDEINSFSFGNTSDDCTMNFGNVTSGANDYVCIAFRDATTGATSLTENQFRFDGITAGFNVGGTGKQDYDDHENIYGYQEDYTLYVSRTHDLGYGTSSFEILNTGAVLNQLYWGKANLGAGWGDGDISGAAGANEDGTVVNILNSVDMNKVISNTYTTDYGYGNITTDSTNWFIFGHRDIGNSTLDAKQFQCQTDPSNASRIITMGMRKNPTNNMYTHTNQSGYSETYEVWLSNNYGYNQGNEWKFYLSSSTDVKNHFFYGYKSDSATDPATVTSDDLNTGAGIIKGYDGGNDIDELAETSISATANRRIVFAVADARIEDKVDGHFRYAIGGNDEMTIKMTKQDLSFTNIAGFTEDYDVWISDKKGIGTGDFTVLDDASVLNQIRIGHGTNATPTANSALIDGMVDDKDSTYPNPLNYNANGSEWSISGLSADNDYIYLAVPRRLGHITTQAINKYRWKPSTGSTNYGTQEGHAGFTCLTAGGAVSWTNANGYAEDYDVLVSVKKAGADMGTAGNLGYWQGNPYDDNYYRQTFWGVSSENGLDAVEVAALGNQVINTNAIDSSGNTMSMTGLTPGADEYVYFSTNNQETNLTTGSDYASAATGTAFTYDGLTMGVKSVVSHPNVIGGYGCKQIHETYQSEITNLRGGASSELKAYQSPKLINKWYYGVSSESDVSAFSAAELTAFAATLTPVTLSNGTVLSDLTTTDPPGAGSEIFTSPYAGAGEFIWFVYPLRYKTANIVDPGNLTGVFHYYAPALTQTLEGGFGGYGSYANGEGHEDNLINDVGWKEQYVFVRSAQTGLGAMAVRITI
jgi:hypothetical protein